MQALKKLKSIRNEELRELRREWQESLRAANTADPRYTEEANRTRQAEARAAAQKAALDGLTALETVAEDAIGRVRRYAESRAPIAPSEALLQEMRQARAWDRARALLDAGRNVQDVVSSADLDTLKALRVELPSYLAAQQPKPRGMEAAGWTEPDPAPVLRLIDQAMVPLLPAGTAARVQAGLDLAAIEPGMRAVLEGLRSEIMQPEAGLGLGTAVAARLADQAAASQTVPDAA